MLRWLVALLLLANVAFYVWSQGWLDDVVGVCARGDREPERLTRQFHPEVIKILTPQAVAAAASAAQLKLVCLEAGPFNAAELLAAEGAMSAALPAGSWAQIEVGKPIQAHLLRVERADAELAAKLATLKSDALGKGFGACARP